MDQMNKQEKPIIEQIALKQLESAVIISQLQNDVDSLILGMQRVLFLLEDDDRTGTAGAVAKVRGNETRIRSLESYRDNLKGMMFGWGALGGIVVTLVIFIFSLLTNK